MWLGSALSACDIGEEPPRFFTTKKSLRRADMIELFIFIGLLAGIVGYTILLAQFLIAICDKVNRIIERKLRQ